MNTATATPRILVLKCGNYTEEQITDAIRSVIVCAPTARILRHTDAAGSKATTGRAHHLATHRRDCVRHSDGGWFDENELDPTRLNLA